MYAKVNVAHILTVRHSGAITVDMRYLLNVGRLRYSRPTRYNVLTNCHESIYA